MDFIEILKWVGIVLAAGFIGYFGRYLAMLIIERARQKKVESPLPPQVSSSPEARIEESRLKTVRKLAKTEAKKAKKGQN